MGLGYTRDIHFPGPPQPIFWRIFFDKYFDEFFWQFFWRNFIWRIFRRIFFDNFFWEDFYWPLIFQPLQALGSEYLRSCLKVQSSRITVGYTLVRTNPLRNLCHFKELTKKTFTVLNIHLHLYRLSQHHVLLLPSNCFVLQMIVCILAWPQWWSFVD